LLRLLMSMRLFCNVEFQDGKKLNGFFLKGLRKIRQKMFTKV